TGICSLNPGVDRLVLSVLLELDAHGEVVSADFCEGVIRSAERTTYTAVNLILAGDRGLRERYAPLVARFELMGELAQILTRRRYKRGAIDFDLPEPVIGFGEAGMVSAIVRGERNVAHRLIEEFMLAANEAVASRLESSVPASIYRIHEKPDPKRVIEFEQVAATFGHSLGIGHIPARDFGYTVRHRDHTKSRRSIAVPGSDIPITSRHYQQLIGRSPAKPEERILSYLMLRSLKQARYSEESAGHFALASACYTHFTSPIRRYPDLIVHRLLKATLHQAPQHSLPTEGLLRTIAEECSFTERRAPDPQPDLIAS